MKPNSELQNLNIKNNPLDLIKSEHKNKTVLEQLILKIEGAQYLEKPLKMLQSLLQKPAITDYDFFMKIKSVINNKLLPIINALKLPKLIRENLIEHINNPQIVPALQDYLDRALSVEDNGYFSVRLLETNQLTSTAASDYAVAYILYVCGGSDNIVNLKMNDQMITIVVDDIAKISWTNETEQAIYKFSEEYLFYGLFEIDFEEDEKIQNQRIFQDTKNKVNIDDIDNDSSRLTSAMDNGNLQKITVKLVSDNANINNELLKKIQAVVIADKEHRLLTKSGLKALKSDLFLKNGWKKYETLTTVKNDEEVEALNYEIQTVTQIISEKINNYIELNMCENSTLCFPSDTEINEFIWNKIMDQINTIL